jgi:hypothetical protein
MYSQNISILLRSGTDVSTTCFGHYIGHRQVLYSTLVSNHTIFAVDTGRWDLVYNSLPPNYWHEIWLTVLCHQTTVNKIWLTVVCHQTTGKEIWLTVVCHQTTVDEISLTIVYHQTTVNETSFTVVYHQTIINEISSPSIHCKYCMVTH